MVQINMVKACIKNVKISGISSVVPPKEISLLDNKNLYFGDKRRIDRVVNSSGFLKRRVAEDNVTTADLCENAANDLLSKLKIDRASIDALLFISYTPDFLMPATSYVLHKKLDLSDNCVVMDIPQACSGYVLGIYQASMLLNNGCKRVLLLVGDTFNKFTDMFQNNSAPVFGDGGSATLLERDETADDMYFNIQSNGHYYDALVCENGGFRNPPKPEDFYEDGTFKYGSKMDGGKIFQFTLREIAPNVAELFKYSGQKKEEIDHFIFHQANKFIVENVAKTLEIPMEKTPITTLTQYGNTCGASIPCTISDRIQESVSQKKNKILLCGFGVGLSWASVLLTTDKIYCSPLRDYEND